MSWTHEEMARRAAAEIKPGDYVNLGIGIPTLVANYVDGRSDVTLQSENGILAMGPFPLPGEEDADLINAGKQTVSERADTSYFSSAESFAMIRGGHIDLAILGGMEVSQTGDLANWMVPGSRVKGMGGAMDLVAGVKRIVVVMDHCTKRGEPKLQASCSLPLTGIACVHRVITNLGVFDVADGMFRLIELGADVDVKQITRETEGHLDTSMVK